jgi:hypothetical protein
MIQHRKGFSRINRTISSFRGTLAAMERALDTGIPFRSSTRLQKSASKGMLLRMAVSVIFTITSLDPKLSAIKGSNSHFVMVESRSNTNRGLLLLIESVHMFDQINNLYIPSDHLFIIVLPVRKTAVRAILEALFIVTEIAAAFSA